jgi:outer membrane receptor protein involved in Fe transport
MLLLMPIIGQTNKGGITGTITDPKGLAVPGAAVTITERTKGTSVVVTSTSEGIYTASALEPGFYDVSVAAPNFKKALIKNVKIDTAAVATVNVQIEVGNVAEQVIVQADVQTVNAESGTISQTVNERQLRDLPLNNRSVLDLAVTMPNVTGDAGSEDADAFTAPAPGFNLSINGGRPGSTVMLADGVNNTGVGIARAVVSFSPETVQEFSVQSSAYSAEYGTTGGGVINITTKSGANKLFGTALVYHRNPATNSRPWRQGTAPRPANNLRFTQTSFTVGGPIVLPKFGEGGKHWYNGKNRSFFFFGYEPRWRTDFTTSTGLMPTAAERAGNFRGLTRTSGGVIPTAVATQFGQASVGTSAIYQQFTVGANGKLVPIVLQTGFQYCQFGAANVTMVANPIATYGGVLQPQCTAAQAALDTEANNPNLNIIPSSFFDPISQKLLGIMDPGQGYFLDGGLVRNYTAVRGINQQETRYTLRLDHNFTSKIKANFRYTKNPTVAVRGNGGDINGNTSAYSNSSQYLATINTIFSTSLINDLRLNYTRGLFSEDYSPEFNIKTGRSFSKEIGLSALTPGGIPLILMSGDNPQIYGSADLGASSSTNNFNVEQRKNISDTLYWIHGNQSWKFGTDDSIAQLQVIPFFAGSGGRWNFRTVNTSNNRGTGTANGGNSLASFLIGVPNGEDFRPALFTYDYQWNSYAFFAQNDWKLKPNLTVNLGLRYSLQKPRTEASNNQGVFRPDLAVDQTLTDTQRRAIATASGVQTADPIPSYVPTSAKIVPFAFAGQGGRSRYITPVDRKAWEPRFGIAWSPKMKVFGFDTEKHSLVIRGGFGVSHAPINGNNRSASPDFGGFTTASTLGPTTGSPNASSGGVDNTSPIRFTGNNALQGSSTPLNILLGTDANGLVFNKSLAITGIAVDFSDPTVGKVPYAENWNIAMQWEPMRNSTIEIAYVGNRGVHLYTPQINISNRNVNTISTLTANNISPTTAVNDPLGRTSLLGATITESIASVYSTYMGFDPLNKFYNARSSSIRHAAYIDFRRRLTRGLNVTANYTFAKSIDDSSDASPDVRILTTGHVTGQVALGGSLGNDRALSAFDVRHTISSTFTWDLPFGRGRRFFKNSHWYVNGPLGGWVLSGVGRLASGNPYQPFLTDPNMLGGSNLNRVVRPDIVSGVPLKNPLWNPKCRAGSAGGSTGGGCEPYLNPAAFMRPVKGQLGNAPRTLSLTAPWKQYLDLSIQKDFPMPWIGGEGKRKINFRIDALNVLNHPIFFWNNLGNTPFGMGTFPTEITTETVGGVAQPITAAEYNTWAAFNGKPLAPASGVTGTPEGAALLAAVRANVNAVRLAPRPGSTSGALPDSFFHTILPQGFATSNALSYDITTLNGYKLYRLRQTYDGNFGTLTNPQLTIGNPAPANSQRYLQFGIRLIF